MSAEESEKSLLAMQVKVNTRLEAMDATIKGVHEGQSLNDKNINSMMTKMDIFGRQMQRLEERLTERTTGHHYSADGGQHSQGGGEVKWTDEFDPTAKDFDAAMTDAEIETKKRAAAMESAETTKNMKSQLSAKTRSQSGRTR